MKVTFLQTGGFAGLSRGCSLDTCDLRPDEAAELTSLVETSGLRYVQQGSNCNRSDAQRLQFTVVDDDGTKHVAIFTDSSLSEQIVPLLRRMRRSSKPVSIT